MNAKLPAPRQDWAYFFDIDGTLVDIVERPEHVRIDLALRQLIEMLHRGTGGAVALVSGRAIADVDALFPGSRLPVAGQHGAERRDASGTVSRRTTMSAELAQVRRELAAVVARRPALRFEDKGLSFALHYRQAPRLGGFVHRVMRTLQAQHRGSFHLQEGKRVVELLPQGSDKGSAVLQFMAEPPFRGRTPVFIGDDVTDETAFATVNHLGGHSIKVGPGPTSAGWRLADVSAVRRWLADGTRPARAHQGPVAGGPP